MLISRSRRAPRIIAVLAGLAVLAACGSTAANVDAASGPGSTGGTTEAGPNTQGALAARVAATAEATKAELAAACAIIDKLAVQRRALIRPDDSPSAKVKYDNVNALNNGSVKGPQLGAEWNPADGSGRVYASLKGPDGVRVDAYAEIVFLGQRGGFTPSPQASDFKKFCSSATDVTEATVTRGSGKDQIGSGLTLVRADRHNPNSDRVFTSIGDVSGGSAKPADILGAADDSVNTIQHLLSMAS